MQCKSCSYGGLVCGRGLELDTPNYRQCSGFTPGGSQGGYLGTDIRTYLKLNAKNLLDQAPKFSFEIEEFKVLCRRWTQLNGNKRRKLIIHHYLIRGKKLDIGEIRNKYPHHYVSSLDGISYVYVRTDALTKATQAKLKHYKEKGNVSF